MPVELLWRCLKNGRLCNFTRGSVMELHEGVLRELSLTAEDQILLRSLFHLSDLPLPRALLS